MLQCVRILHVQCVGVSGIDASPQATGAILRTSLNPPFR
jgi:hypothetical protein